ncbi:cation:proton antiporter [Chitinophaga japonensis]|uniref:CPA1 family monovalent cation:H+ antiporter n=1 Tax=Chitinophaga japonensis TaxID=104662 RepID=A0A562ST65_CHIJA|nr:sodium:proton antiporter [Chitinophaga japonensis]TWI84467.1 CPA1 family monovalent cation:H+ antiporter [Chitinophaga japonensis]
MHFYYLLIFIIAATTLFSYLNYKLTRWPAPMAVMIFSLVSAVLLLLLHNLFPELTADVTDTMSEINLQDLVLKIVLGFLLFAATFRTDVMHFRREARPILALALLSTLASTFITGGLVYFLAPLLGLRLSLINCLLFGTVIAPTDPIAVLGLLRKAGIPKSLELQIKGESMINDGIAIVLFTTFLETGNASQGGSVLGHAVLLFLQEAAGGALFGALIGYLGLQALKTLNNYKLEILVTLVIVMGGYTLADLIHVSGPLTMVAAGLICSRGKTLALSAESMRHVSSFWELTDSFLNVVVFLLIGFELLVIPLNLLIAVMGLACILIVLVSRFLAVLLPFYLLRSRFERHSPLMLTWGALRGGVSIALALSLPAAMHRHELLPVTYLIAVFSIIVQGMTIGKLSNKLGLQRG